MLNVPYFLQQADGYCLPACAQMVLAYLGIARSQNELGRQLGLIKGAGVPYSNITRLASPQLNVMLATGSLDDIKTWLGQGSPVIAFVQAGELPLHRGKRFQHAIVLVDIKNQDVYMLDPDTKIIPAQAQVADFYLAWDETDNHFAVILKR